jgi:LPS export ABC transporter protein LptC
MKTRLSSILIWGIAGVLFINCQKDPKKLPDQELPSQIITNFHLYESKTGKKLYDISAQKAYIYEKAQRIDVSQVVVDFYNQNGTITRLEAQSGSVYLENSDLAVRDNVVVRTPDSTYLYTDSLRWNNAQQTIFTDAPVKIISLKGIIEGHGLISDAQLKRIEVRSRITAKSQYEF